MTQVTAFSAFCGLWQGGSHSDAQPWLLTHAGAQLCTLPSCMQQGFQVIELRLLAKSAAEPQHQLPAALTYCYSKAQMKKSVRQDAALQRQR